MIKKLYKSHKEYILLGIVLILAIFFRYYHIYQWQFFGMDQAYEAFLAQNIVTGHHFPLIGVNASDTGLYLGPLFIYFAAIPFFLSGGNPLGWSIVASLLGVVTTLVIFWVGKEMYNTRVGFLAAFLYAGSMLAAFYDRQFWNPMFVPLFSLIIGYFSFLLLKNSKKSVIVLAVLMGLSLHIHLSLLIFLPLVLYVTWKKKKLIGTKLIVASIILFIFLQLPQIFFEVRHGFVNTRAAFALLSAKSNNTQTFLSRNSIFLSSVGRFVLLPFASDLSLQSGQCISLIGYKKDDIFLGFIVLFLILIVYFDRAGVFVEKVLKRKRKGPPVEFSAGSRVIVFIFFLSLLFTEFYTRGVFEYYFLFLFPWLAILLGRILDYTAQNRYGRMSIISVLLIFAVFNLVSLFTARFSFSYEKKMAAVNFAKKYVTAGNYSLEAVGECARFGGYRYLFGHFAGIPVSSYMDSYFGWLYPTGRVKEQNLTVLLSLIDPREDAKTLSKWENIKLSLILENRIIAQNNFDTIQIYVLGAKK